MYDAVTTALQVTCITVNTAVPDEQAMMVIAALIRLLQDSQIQTSTSPANPLVVLAATHFNPRLPLGPQSPESAFRPALPPHKPQHSPTPESSKHGSQLDGDSLHDSLISKDHAGGSSDAHRAVTGSAVNSAASHASDAQAATALPDAHAGQTAASPQSTTQPESSHPGAGAGLPANAANASRGGGVLAALDRAGMDQGEVRCACLNAAQLPQQLQGLGGLPADTSISNAQLAALIHCLHATGLPAICLLASGIAGPSQCWRKMKYGHGRALDAISEEFIKLFNITNCPLHVIRGAGPLRMRSCVTLQHSASNFLSLCDAHALHDLDMPF